MKNRTKLLSIILTTALFVGCGSTNLTTNEQKKDVAKSAANDTSKKILDPIPNADVELEDQNGIKHKLSDYKGKKVFLNFMWSGCGPCRKEIPDINTLYQDYGSNKEDVVVLSVVLPKSDKFTQTPEGDINTVKSFIKEYNINYPVLFDTEGKLFTSFGIRVFPTTFMLTETNKIYGYISGALTYQQMESIIAKTTDQ